MVYMGNNLRDGDGMKINDSTDSLWGTPIDLPCARHVFAISLLNGWNIQTADVEAAYLVSDLRGPPVYLRLPPEIWQACDVDSNCLSKFRDPCVRVKKAMYGLPRSGFDWYMHCHEILTIKLGWKKVANFDSLYLKSECILAVYVDDMLMAGQSTVMGK